MTPSNGIQAMPHHRVVSILPVLAMLHGLTVGCRSHTTDPAQCTLHDLPFLASESLGSSSAYSNSREIGYTSIVGPGGVVHDVVELSFGLDWIPLETEPEEPGKWLLEDFDGDVPADAAEAGFGVMFFQNDDGLWAFTWGPLLPRVFPGAAPITHLREKLPSGAGNYGLDFNAWAVGLGARKHECYETPTPPTAPAIYWFSRGDFVLRSSPVDAGVIVPEITVHEDFSASVNAIAPGAAEVKAFALDLKHKLMILGFGDGAHDFYAMGIEYDTSDGRVQNVRPDPGHRGRLLPLYASGGGAISGDPVPVRPVTSCSAIDPRLLKRVQRSQ